MDTHARQTICRCEHASSFYQADMCSFVIANLGKTFCMTTYNLTLLVPCGMHNTHNHNNDGKTAGDGMYIGFGQLNYQRGMCREA